MLETEELSFEPCMADFKEGLATVVAAFQDCTLAFPNLLPDPFFHSFTRYGWQGPGSSSRVQENK